MYRLIAFLACLTFLSFAQGWGTAFLVGLAAVALVWVVAIATELLSLFRGL